MFIKIQRNGYGIKHAIKGILQEEDEANK